MKMTERWAKITREIAETLYQQDPHLAGLADEEACLRLAEKLVAGLQIHPMPDNRLIPDFDVTCEDNKP